MSKDTTSSDSLRKAFVRKVREMDVTVNWLNFELWLESGWKRMLTTLERKLQAGSVVREESRFPVSSCSGWYA